MGKPPLKSKKESKMPDINQNARPLVNNNCIHTDKPSVLWVRITLTACGT